MAILDVSELKIGSITSSVSTISSLILVRPDVNVGYQAQPQPTKYGDIPKAPPKFLFNHEGENLVESSSEITDHYVEDNVAVQDHIALKPLTVNVQGFVGELISDQLDFRPGTNEQLNFYESKLTPLSQYAPDVHANVLRLRNTATRLAQTAELARDSYSNFKDGLASTQQQDAFNLFYAYQQNRVLFTIQTPWAVFTNMAIETMRAIQNSESRFMTSFEMNFKQMNFVRTSKIEPDSTVPGKEFDGRGLASDSVEVDGGQTTPTDNLPFGEALQDFSENPDNLPTVLPEIGP